GSELSLSEWDLAISQVGGSHIVSVSGVLLPPGTSLELAYNLEPAGASDLPAAKVAFKAIDGYRGEAQSSFFVAGAEVRQQWDPLNGGWVVVPAEMQSTADPANIGESDALFYSAEEMYATEEDSTPEVQQGTANSSIAGWLDPISASVLKVQELIHNTLGGTIETAGEVLAVAEGMAIDAVENYLYAVIIAIALGVFLIVYVLISR
ncbi:hypothetical protein, partial [Methanomethylovorans sp.]|uniref:hypothetical protein n=1 Tax=Methanomethylovorans sp. TaxID=2758717 RepID=UPI00351C124B